MEYATTNPQYWCMEMVKGHTGYSLHEHSRVSRSIVYGHFCVHEHSLYRIDQLFKKEDRNSPASDLKFISQLKLTPADDFLLILAPERIYKHDTNTLLR